MLKKVVLLLTVCACGLLITGCPDENKVVVIDEFPQIDVEQVWADVVEFFTGDSSVPFEVGDIIVGSGDGGFLRRVTAVIKDGGAITTETSEASLAEAVENGTLDGSCTFVRDDFEKAGLCLAKADGVLIDISGMTLYNGNGVNIQVSHGVLEYAPTITLHSEFEDWKMTEFYAFSEGELFLSMDVKVTVSAGQNLNFVTDVIPVVTQPFVFYIGAIPVAGRAYLKIPFGISGMVTAATSAETGFESSQYLSVGMQMQDDVWTDLTDLEEFAPVAHPLVITLSSGGALQFYVKPTVGLNLYECSDLSGYVKPYLGANAQFVPSPLELVVNAGVDGGIAYQLGIFDFRLINKEWNFTGPSWELYRYSLPYDVPTTFTITLP